MPTDAQAEKPAEPGTPDPKKPDGDKPAEPEKKPLDPAKKRRNWLIGGAVSLVLVIGVFAWWWQSRKYENTDDAQIDGHLNPIAARVAGTIVAVHVEDNVYVESGAHLVDLDTRDFAVAQAQTRGLYDQGLAQLQGEQPNLPITLTSNSADTSSAEAEVTNANAVLASAEHDYAGSAAQLRQAEANNVKAQSDRDRYKQLIDRQEVAQADYDQYDATAKAQAAVVAAQKEAVASAARMVDQRRAQLTEKQFKMNQTTLNAPRQILISHANIQAKIANLQSIKAQMQQDQLNIGYCEVVAPVAGLITERSAELGARISIGQQLMMLVQTDDLWVTANFKETQLRKMRVGQRVTIAVDTLDKTLEGYIESMPAATGDRSSALPPENATGNFVKVVQRLPVRIRFRPNQDGLKALRPGMSVEPTVHFE
jgi:membrane fusion protein (multidrug efflux system)